MKPTDPSTRTDSNPQWSAHWRSVSTAPDCSRSHRLVPLFFEGFKGQMRPGQTITHFGCGKGLVTKDFLAKGFNVTLVDISPFFLDEEIRKLLTLFAQQVKFVQACLWQLPENLKSSYWIYCSHMLEYIPEDTIDLVLDELAKRMRFGGYISIALKDEDPKHPLQTLQSKGWWEKKLLAHFRILSEDIVQGEECLNCRLAPIKNLG